MRRSTLLFGSDDRPTRTFAAFMQDAQIPGDDLSSIDTALQARFFQKNTDGSPKERWELNKVQINCPIEGIHQHLAVCGFFNETKPSLKKYTYGAWPGALATRALERINDLSKVWMDGVRWEKTIVFGGERPLQHDKENYEACCRILGREDNRSQSSWKSINPQTELDMMMWMWENTIGRSLLTLLEQPVVFVDTPMKPPSKEGGPAVRPTTEDTVQEWLGSNPEPGSILLSSGAPYGMAMDEAFWMMLEPHGFTVETFGHTAPDLPIENLMREVAGTVNRIRRARKP